MKNLLKNLCIYFLISIFILNTSYSQDECGTQDFPNGQAPYVNEFFGGYLKPHRTDLDNGSPSQSNATLKCCLFLFSLKMKMIVSQLNG